MMSNNVNMDNDLFVFGYSCKLFRDDEKAAFIDAGKHLIPWMDDDTMKIDRYDVRSTIHDLKQVEVPACGYNRFEGISVEEKKLERLCDKERFRSLYIDDTDYIEDPDTDPDPKEETTDRPFTQVPYSYEESEKFNSEENNEVIEEEPFVPSAPLPDDMILPKTVKHNSIIEKTARFICDEGPQMEILMRAKQKENPLFRFLSIDDPLFKYYRFVLARLKQESTKDRKSIPDNANNANNVNNVNNVNNANIAKIPAIQTSSKLILPRLPRVDAAPDILNCNNAVVKVETSRTVIPPKEVRSVIEKLAVRVASNGSAFEDLIREKNDARFEFLNPSSVFYPFYKTYLSTIKIDEVALDAAICKNSNETVEKMESTNNKTAEFRENSSDDCERLLLERKRQAALLLVNLHLDSLNHGKKTKND